MHAAMMLMGMLGREPATVEEIVARILAQEDDNGRRDAYWRRIVMVEAGNPEGAEQACFKVAREVREYYRETGRWVEEVKVLRCDVPPGRRRYRFGKQHAERILELCPDACLAPPAWRSSLDWIYSREAWVRPQLLMICNADAIAQAGRDLRRVRSEAGDYVRALSDVTRVRQVLFGSEAMRKMLEANRCLSNRTDYCRLEEKRVEREGLRLVQGFSA